MPEIKQQQFIKKRETTQFDNSTPKISTKVLKASDGKKYKYLGNQWAQLLPSGKTGIFAKKVIGSELDKIAGITRKKISKKPKAALKVGGARRKRRALKSRPIIGVTGNILHNLS